MATYNLDRKSNKVWKEMRKDWEEKEKTDNGHKSMVTVFWGPDVTSILTMSISVYT